MESLVGKTVDNVLIGDDGEYIVFVLTDGTQQAFLAEGDCCSHSWIESTWGLDNLLLHEVLDVVEVEMGDLLDIFGADNAVVKKSDPEYVGDVVQLYKITLVTHSGDFDIEFRNDSNGYYGGWLAPINGNAADIDASFRMLTEDL